MQALDNQINTYIGSHGVKTGFGSLEFSIYEQMKSRSDKNPMEYTSRFYGMTTPITMSKGYKFIPEFMWYDNGDDNRNSSDKKSG